MSTYTDLKNRVKENITVGYDANDRTTLQKVKFHNEENEYWGTFTGKVDVADIIVERGTLNDVSVYDSYIKNATLVNADGIKINLSELGEGIDEISNVTVPALRRDIMAVSAEISTLQDVPGEVERLKGALDEVSAAVSSEIRDRVSADLAISAYLSARFDEKISAEENLRISADDELDTAIKAETDARVQAIKDLSGASEDYVEDNKHYHIQPVNSDVKMPFKAREFAVNVINDYDLPDAFVKDAATGDMVAKVERYAVSSRNCEFVPFADAPDKYMSILGPNAFVFGDGQTQRDCKDPAYRLTYYRNGESGAVTDQHFGLSPVDTGIRHVYYNDVACGVVTQASEETVVSGYVRITADSQSPLSVFADGLDHYFKVNVPVEFNDGNDRLIFEEATRAFRCELGVMTRMYEGLSSGAGTEWGKVFRDGIEGAVTSLSAFSVSFQPTESQVFSEKSFRLSEENGFKADVWRDTQSTNLDVVKCANGVVSYYNEKIRYGYSVKIRTAVDERVGEIVIGEYNRVLSDDFGQVDLVLSGAFPGSQVWLSPITLFRNSEGGYSRETTVLGREISASLSDKSRVKVVIKSGDITDTMYGTVTGSPYAKVDDSLPPYKESQALSFPLACASSVRVPSDVKTAYVSSRDSETKLTCYFDCVTQYSYAENAYGVNDIVIEIPDKPAGSSISREFLFVVKPRKIGAKANIRFVGENGRDIKWFSNKKPTFEILTETFITFKLQEVRDERFMVVDWNLNKQEQEIDDLYAKLAAEASARISSDLSIVEEIGIISSGVWSKFAEHDRQISGISGEVSALISRDRKDVSFMGELTANGYRSLSTFLGNQSVFGPSPMTASVHKNWMYRMSGNSEMPMVDAAGVSSYIGDNDYVLFKSEKQVKDILFSDMNFIRDSQAETEAIAAKICSWTNENFVHLSGGNSISGYNKFVEGTLTISSATVNGVMTVGFGKLVDAATASSLVDISSDITAQVCATSSWLSGQISAEIDDRTKAVKAVREELCAASCLVSAWSEAADVALSNTLTGVINTTSTLLSSDLKAHVTNTSNPHGVTAGQVNAYLCSQTSSNVQLKNKFDSLSTYADIKAKLSSDGYALTSNTSSVAELNVKFSQYALSNDVSSAGQLKTKFDSLSTYANIKSQLSVDGYALTSKTSSDIQLKNKFDTLSTYANIKTQLSVDGYALSSQVDKSAKDSIKTALTKAPALNTILTGADSELLDNLDQRQIISVLIDIKKLFASLSA